MPKFVLTLLACFFTLATYVGNVSAQDVRTADDVITTQDVSPSHVGNPVVTLSEAEFERRLGQMERENRELARVVQSAALEKTSGTPAGTPVGTPLETTLDEDRPGVFWFGDGEAGASALGRDVSSAMWNMSRDDLEAELARTKGWQWRRDAFTVTPYAWVWLSTLYESNRLFPGEFPMYVRPEFDDPQGHTYFDMKSTRLGTVVTAPETALFPGSQISGVFEIDFEGKYVLESETDITLRKAYFEVKNEDWLLLLGQTWELISPVQVTMLNWGGGVAGGNFGFRRPMLRYDRYFRLRDGGKWTVQAALLSSNAVLATVTRHHGTYEGKMGRYPEFQTRVERSFGPCGLWQSAQFGFSAQVSNREYMNMKLGDELSRTAWSLHTDWTVRFSDRFFLVGEVWAGELLGFSFSAIVQDLNLETLESVGATGYWFTFAYDLTPEVHTSLGYCVDDPWNSTLCKGMRGKNSVIYTNISRDFTKQLNIGLEYCYYRTEYVEQGTADSHFITLVLNFKL